MNDEIQIQSCTKRKLLAIEFRRVFDNWFKEAEGSEMFLLSKNDFDSFVINGGFCTYEELPEIGTADWAKFRQESNTARYELNKAAEIGTHGEPPYRIDSDGSVLRVRLLANIVKVTHTMIAKQIESLVDTKCAEFSRMMNYVNSKEVIINLPPALQAEIGSQRRLFDMTIGNVTHMITNYVENVTDTYNKAKEHKKEEKSKQLAIDSPDFLS